MNRISLSAIILLAILPVGLSSCMKEVHHIMQCHYYTEISVYNATGHEIVISDIDACISSSRVKDQIELTYAPKTTIAPNSRANIIIAKGSSEGDSFFIDDIDITKATITSGNGVSVCHMQKNKFEFEPADNNICNWESFKMDGNRNCEENNCYYDYSAIYTVTENDFAGNI